VFFYILNNLQGYDEVKLGSMARRMTVKIKTIKKKNWYIEYKVTGDKVINLFSAFRSKELRGWSEVWQQMA